MIAILAINIEENSNKINTSQLLPYVAAEKRGRIAQLKYQSDVHRILLADLLIRAVACRYLNLNNMELDFRTNPYGKPYLNGIEDFHFNLSHSGKWVVAAADNMEIGIDIEKIAPIAMDIARIYFSAEEFNYMMEKREEDRLPLFYDFWTLKESYIKALGRGFEVELNSFTIEFDGEGQASLKGSSPRPVFLCQYPLDDEYRLSLCAFNSEFPAGIQIVDLGWIMESINKRT